MNKAIMTTVIMSIVAGMAYASDGSVPTLDCREERFGNATILMENGEQMLGIIKGDPRLQFSFGEIEFSKNEIAMVVRDGEDPEKMHLLTTAGESYVGTPVQDSLKAYALSAEASEQKIDSFFALIPIESKREVQSNTSNFYSIRLQNGDRLTAAILDSTIHIKNGYTILPIEREQVVTLSKNEGIHIEKDQKIERKLGFYVSDKELTVAIHSREQPFKLSWNQIDKVQKYDPLHDEETYTAVASALKPMYEKVVTEGVWLAGFSGSQEHTPLESETSEVQSGEVFAAAATESEESAEALTVAVETLTVAMESEEGKDAATELARTDDSESFYYDDDDDDDYDDDFIYHEAWAANTNPEESTSQLPIDSSVVRQDTRETASETGEVSIALEHLGSCSESLEIAGIQSQQVAANDPYLQEETFPIEMLSSEVKDITPKTHSVNDQFVLIEAKKSASNADHKAYLIGKKLVTNAEYSAFVEKTRHSPPSDWKGGSVPEGLENQPVVGISKKDAEDYARWKNQRLPTRYEIEAAVVLGVIVRNVEGNGADEWVESSSADEEETPGGILRGFRLAADPT